MQRPKYQWFTSKYAALRQEFIDLQSMHAFVRQLDLHPSRLEQFIEQTQQSKRVEVFALINTQSPESSLGTSSPTIFCLLSPQLQMIVDPKQSITNAELKEFAFAIQAWLVARGFDHLNIWYEQRQLLNDPNLPHSGVAQSGIERLNDWIRIELQEPEDHSRQSLISLAPSNLDICQVLGLLPQIIACEDSSTFPTDLAENGPVVERLGPDLNPNLERVIELEADLILSSLSVPGMERIVTKLYVAKQNQLVFAPRSIDEVVDNIREVGKAMGVVLKAEEVINELAEQKTQLLALRSDPPIPIYLEWWPKPMFSPGRDCFSNELIELAGGINIFKDKAGSSIEVSPKEVAEKQPKLCFISWCGVPLHKLNTQNVINRKGLELLHQDGRFQVVPIDEAFTGRPGPFMLEASRQMAKSIQAYKNALDPSLN